MGRSDDTNDRRPKCGSVVVGREEADSLRLRSGQALREASTHFGMTKVVGGNAENEPFRSGKLSRRA
jgi:hypothetical protein